MIANVNRRWLADADRYLEQAIDSAVDPDERDIAYGLRTFVRALAEDDVLADCAIDNAIEAVDRVRQFGRHGQERILAGAVVTLLYSVDPDQRETPGPPEWLEAIKAKGIGRCTAPDFQRLVAELERLYPGAPDLGPASRGEATHAHAGSGGILHWHTHPYDNEDHPGSIAGADGGV